MRQSPGQYTHFLMVLRSADPGWGRLHLPDGNLIGLIGFLWFELFAAIEFVGFKSHIYVTERGRTSFVATNLLVGLNVCNNFSPQDSLPVQRFFL